MFTSFLRSSFYQWLHNETVGYLEPFLNLTAEIRAIFFSSESCKSFFHDRSDLRLIYARSIKCKSNKYIIAQLYKKVKLQAHHLTNDTVTHLDCTNEKRFRSFRNNAHSCFSFLLILGTAIKPPFLPKKKKTQRRYIKPCLCHFSGLKQGKYPFLSLSKNHKVFVLTCGCVWNCGFWATKTPYCYDVFCCSYSIFDNDKLEFIYQVIPFGQYR